MLESLGFAAGTMALLVVALRVVRRAFGAGARNPARTLAEAGEVAGTLLVAAAAAAGCRQGDDFGADALRVAAYGLTGVVLLVVGGRLGVDVILRRRLASEIERGNVAAGLVAAAHVVATSVITASLFRGTDWETLGVACVWFVIAQATLHLLVALFRALTSYDDAAEVLDGNLAAAMSYSGITVAVGILVAHAADGPYAGFVTSLQEYGRALLAGLALYPVRQVLVQCVILGARPAARSGILDASVARDRDVGIGAMEAGTYVATALVVRSFA